ncbi:MAG: hypothetical protein GX493_09750 [Firmicutes bacterium]|nr:hypothetical protein [Bacillota bacterium]
MMVVAKPVVTDPRRNVLPRTRRAAHLRPVVLGRSALFWLVCFIILASNAVLYGFLTASTFRVNVLTRELAEAEETGRRLELEIARLSSYPRLLRDAERRLALRPAASGLLAVGYVAPEIPVSRSPIPSGSTGLIATIHDYFRAFGRAAASIR